MCAHGFLLPADKSALLAMPADTLPKIVFYLMSPDMLRLHCCVARPSPFSL